MSLTIWFDFIATVTSKPTPEPKNTRPTYVSRIWVVKVKASSSLNPVKTSNLENTWSARFTSLRWGSFEQHMQKYSYLWNLFPHFPTAQPKTSNFYSQFYGINQQHIVQNCQVEGKWYFLKKRIQFDLPHRVDALYFTAVRDASLKGRVSASFSRLQTEIFTLSFQNSSSSVRYDGEHRWTSVFKS